MMYSFRIERFLGVSRTFFKMICTLVYRWFSSRPLTLHHLKYTLSQFYNRKRQLGISTDDIPVSPSVSLPRQSQALSISTASKAANHSLADRNVDESQRKVDSSWSLINQKRTFCESSYDEVLQKTKGKLSKRTPSWNFSWKATFFHASSFKTSMQCEKYGIILIFLR